MSNFCPKCGKALDIYGKCPSCEKMPTPPFKKVRERKPINPEKAKFIPQKNGKKNRFVIWTITVLSVITIIVSALCTATFFDILDIPFINDIYIGMDLKDVKTEQVKTNSVKKTQKKKKPQTETEPQLSDEERKQKYKVTPPDADEYFQKNATVNMELGALTSETAFTESDVCRLLEERGFENISVTTNYTMYGEYTDEVQISRYSSDAHPMYQAFYTAADGDVWMILIVNDAIMANPISYNTDHASNVPIFVSETDTLTSYDSTLNKFYISVPKRNIAVVKTVDIIDAETLNNLTF
ncbi:MAG: hypothetical protein E7394_01435 [Ruminococcaceae bacterium]|nr:hypothetical protein [Oscillospiraceae bacterium]